MVFVGQAPNVVSIPDPYDFSDLVLATRSELRQELASVVAQLCTAIESCAYIRSTDGRSNEYYEREGQRDVLTEKKWLILKLLDTYAAPD